MDSAALSYAGGTHRIQDIQEACLVGMARLWLGDKCAAVTEIITYPRRKSVRIWLAGGDLGELTDEILPQIEEYAAAQGADRVEIAGRRGWQRHLAAKDYHPAAVVVTKEIQQ